MNQYFLVFLDILQRDYVKYPLLVVLGILVLVFTIGGLIRDNLAMAGWEKKRFKRVNGKKYEVSDNGKFVLRDGDSYFEIDTVPSESITVATERIMDMDDAKPEFEYDDTDEANASMVVETPSLPKKKFDDTENAIVLESKPFVSGAKIMPEYRTSFTPIDLPKIFRNKNNGEKQIERVTLGATRTVIETLSAAEVEKEKTEFIPINSGEPVLPIINKPVEDTNDSLEDMPNVENLADNELMAENASNDNALIDETQNVGFESAESVSDENANSKDEIADVETNGVDNSNKTLYCSSCGEMLEANAKFCGNCGKKVEAVFDAQSETVQVADDSESLEIDRTESENLNISVSVENAALIADESALSVMTEDGADKTSDEIKTSSLDFEKQDEISNVPWQEISAVQENFVLQENSADNLEDNTDAKNEETKSDVNNHVEAEAEAARLAEEFNELKKAQKEIEREIEFAKRLEKELAKANEAAVKPSQKTDKVSDAYLKRIISHTPNVGEFDEAIVFGRYQIMTSDDGKLRYHLFTNKNEAIYGRGGFDDIRILLSHINSFKLAIKSGNFSISGDVDHGFRFILKRGEAEFKGIIVPTKEKAVKTIEEIKYYGLTEIIRKD